MDGCDICLNNKHTGSRLFIFSTRVTEGYAEIQENQKYRFHQNSDCTPQDILNEYIEQNISEIKSKSAWFGKYCYACRKTEFSSSEKTCCRCNVDTSQLDNIYFIIFEENINLDVSDVEKKSLAGLRRASNSSVQPTHVICEPCLESLGINIKKSKILRI